MTSSPCPAIRHAFMPGLLLPAWPVIVIITWAARQWHVNANLSHPGCFVLPALFVRMLQHCWRSKTCCADIRAASCGCLSSLSLFNLCVMTSFSRLRMASNLLLPACSPSIYLSLYLILPRFSHVYLPNLGMEEGFWQACAGGETVA